MIARLFALAALHSLLACTPQAEEPPPPVAMSEDVLGHYCQMYILEHDGPKAQVHVAGDPLPRWFSQVRDAVAFTRLPEETDVITAIYVSDMGRAPSWFEPGATNFVDATTAYYVIGSERVGGMGAPETVPFADEAQAQRFAGTHGGTVVTYEAIPDAYVLAPVEVGPAAVPTHTAPAGGRS